MCSRSLQLATTSPSTVKADRNVVHVSRECRTDCKSAADGAYSLASKVAGDAMASNLEEGCHPPALGHLPECERGLHVCMVCDAAILVAFHVIPAESRAPGVRKSRLALQRNLSPSSMPPRPAASSLEFPQTEAPQSSPANPCRPHSPLPATD